MRVWVLVLLGCLTLGETDVTAQPVPIALGWDYASPVAVKGWYLLRCLVPAGEDSCVPTVDLPGMPLIAAARTYTDLTGVAGTTPCWAAQPDGAQGQGRLAASNIVCTTLEGGGITKPPAVTNLHEVVP